MRSHLEKFKPNVRFDILQKRNVSLDKNYYCVFPYYLRRIMISFLMNDSKINIYISYNQKENFVWLKNSITEKNILN